MAQCVYISPDGIACTDSAVAPGDRCFWHDPQTDKTAADIKMRLEGYASNEAVMTGFCLQKAHLADVYLMEADLRHADLTRANLQNGHLFGIDLRHANLFKVDFSRANLREARLEGANMLGVVLQDANMERVHWGPGNRVQNHIQADALASGGDNAAAKEKYLEAEEIYRSIRKCYEAAGTADIAGEFFFNEMVAKRKQMPLFSFKRAWSKLIDVLCGYGEIPYRIIGSSMVYILSNALLFGWLGMYHNDRLYAFGSTLGAIDNLTYLGYAIYFSIVTFTTLGYGDFSPAGWAKPFAAIEAFVGAFMIALFILAFVKKMTR